MNTATNININTSMQIRMHRGSGAKWVTFGPFLQSRSHISKNMELIDPVSFLNMHDRSWEQIKLIFAVYGKKICRY